MMALQDFILNEIVQYEIKRMRTDLHMNYVAKGDANQAQQTVKVKNTLLSAIIMHI